MTQTGPRTSGVNGKEELFSTRVAEAEVSKSGAAGSKASIGLKPTEIKAEP